ncbi:thiol:disulfide interchange protein [Komagataeibacter rhaeticus]|uniref:thioredoxin domain-containing protein n=1 Tax=Komagataeibacter rhaeticus TaxID=215221 RepID=UPI0004D5DA98|nr:thioredoxin domain-containing protein [Komagataeibacter rhaeticus]KDU96931.1 thiol:disulfide interchange protein [Komagataeibacter rhaeticus AF1]MBL7238844.1 thioredoxin domain-containing protein [Komagataeibacter rhaeticus]PYD52914.1 thiol:disulfide interchange protein [Komagataeibacter rhaeticus]GBQ11615.1 thiol:disulfide interchange protein [Komagataeibacter rhaeticus DSM 16663]
MPIKRRTLLALAPALITGGSLLSGRAMAEAADPRLSIRAVGNPQARVRVEEWFSLTCTHCARFAAEIFPEVRSRLIDTGKVYYIFRDFPLDQVALTASMVARSLPPERYEPFVLALLSSQDHWAFGKTPEESQEEIRKMAALAGMSSDVFQQTIHDDTLRHAIMDEEDRAQAQYKIDGTPTFRFNDKEQVAQELTYAEFARKVEAASN